MLLCAKFIKNVILKKRILVSDAFVWKIGKKCYSKEENIKTIIQTLLSH